MQAPFNAVVSMALSNPRFEASYGRLFGPNVSADSHASDGFFEQFYARFLTHPAVAELFAETDMERQVQMLKRSLFQLVAYYVSGQPTSELRRITEVHARLNVSGAMFDDWLEALIDTVADVDHQADEATLLAWCWALAPGITFMRLQLGSGEPQSG